MWEYFANRLDVISTRKDGRRSESEASEGLRIRPWRQRWRRGYIQARGYLKTIIENLIKVYAV